MQKFTYSHLLPPGLNDHSKVWIYQCNRIFTLGEALETEELLNRFTDNWQSHGAKVKGYANLFFGQFIILMADESDTGVSGCSTDSSVRLIKELEKRFNVNLFDRQLLAFLIKDKIQLLPLPQLTYSIQNGFINGETIYFNNLVQSKKELENNWMIPVKQSWLASKLPETSNVARY